jgi:hypothetical protein
MPVIHLPEEALNYKNQWVAFSSDFLRVVGHGPTAKEAHDDALESGEEHAVLFYIPKKWPDLLML